MPPSRSCTRTSTLTMTAKISETKNAKRASRTKWLCMRPRASLPAERYVVRVDDDEQVEQSRDDQKRVAVLIRHGAHLSGAITHRARDEIQDADADVGERRKRHERLGRIDRKHREEPAADRQPDHVHDRQRDD